MKKGLKINSIFIDESGKPEVFSTKGINLVEKNLASKHLVLAAVRASDQLKIQELVTEFKLSLLRDKNLTKNFSPAYSLESFHAQVDYLYVKEKFYNFINSIDIKIDVIVVEKLKAYRILQQNPGRMYGVVAGHLLKNLLHLTKETQIIFSRKDTKYKLRKELEVEVERIRLEYIQSHKRLDAKYSLKFFHNPHYTHGGLQIADYIAYAIFQVFEHKNFIWYKIIKNKIGKIHDLFNKKYYTRGKPLELN